MKRVSRILIATMSFGLILSAHPEALAHGEDQAGPHGGMIRMPGPFHTELVKEKDGRFRIYLLDISFKNPITEKSSVSAQISEKGKTRPLNCTTEKDFFLCKDSGKTVTGELVIKATREGVVGNEARYPLSNHQ